MSRWGKRKEKFGGDSEEKAYPNKVAKTEDGDDSENIVVCELSGKRRVSVRSWQGKIWVDIRDFYEKDGKVLPGKKDQFYDIVVVASPCSAVRCSPPSGITLSMDQWNILRDHIEEIDEAVSEKS